MPTGGQGHLKKAGAKKRSTGGAHGSGGGKKRKTSSSNDGAEAAAPMDAVVDEANRLWEILRQKKVRDNKKSGERAELLAKLMILACGRVTELAMKHTSARVVQTLYALSGAADRAAILAELKGKLVEMSVSKYSHHTVEKILLLSNAEERKAMVAELLPAMRRLVTHRVGYRVADCVFCEAGSAADRALAVRVCCGKEFSLLSSPLEWQKQVAAGKAASVAAVIEDNEKKKGTILRNLHELLLTLTDKQIYQSKLACHLLGEYLPLADYAQCLEIISGATPLVEQFLGGNSKFSELAMVRMVSYATAKERKLLCKALKGRVVELSQREFGHRVVLTMLTAIDDTTLVSKGVVSEMVEGLEALVGSKYGRRTILHLLAPNKAAYFDERTRELLQPTLVLDGEVKRPTSKKDPETRRLELLETLAVPLAEHCIANALALITSQHGGDVVLVLASGGAQASVRAAVAAVAHEGVDDYYAGRMLQKLIVASPAEFAPTLLEKNKAHVAEWASMKGGQWVVAALAKCDGTKADVQQLLKLQTVGAALDGLL